MSKLQHLFKVGQNVKCSIDGTMQKGIVTEVHDDHIIVDIPEINNHCWFEEGIESRLCISNIQFLNLQKL